MPDDRLLYQRLGRGFVLSNMIFTAVDTRQSADVQLDASTTDRAVLSPIR